MKIYKIDSKDKIRTLEIYAEGSDVIQISGILGGQLVTNRSACVPKNVGRTNETTAEEQAILEAEAKLILKLDKEYFRTVEEATSQIVILPMLAKDYKKESKKIDWSKPVYVQPKLDGQRALTNMESMISRQGNEIETMSHIMDSIQKTNTIENYNIDGELYVHGLTFQQIMTLVKKVRINPYVEGLATTDVKYHVYDMVMDAPFTTRYEKLKEICANIPNIKIVKTIQIFNEQELQTYHKEFIAKGYEGTIIRHGNDKYKVKGRSSSLLKYKDFIDETFTIIDIIPSEKRPEQGKPIFEKNGVKFGGGMRYSHSGRIDFLKNKKKYIGLTAEVRFFEYTDEGLPRFPIMVGIRNDK